MSDELSNHTGYGFGEFKVHVATGELWLDGTKLKVQELPFQVLVALLEKPGELVTREELQKRLWNGDVFVDFETGLNVAVKKLRSALGDASENPRYIETLPRRGYRFVAPVEVLNGNGSLRNELISSLPANSATTVPTSPQSQRTGPSALGGEIDSSTRLRVLLGKTKLSVATAVLLSLIAFGSLSAWWLHRVSRERWARNEALPRIAELIDNNRVFMDDNQVSEAYDLAVEAERYIPNDPMLRRFWPDISWDGSIMTTPSGVSVFRSKYGAAVSAWEFVGRTPIQKLRLPAIDLEWKFELSGFGTVTRASLSPDPITVTMDKDGKAPAGMVRVEFPRSTLTQSKPVSLFGLPGYEDLPAVALGNFWIDKYEITNSQFKQFLDAGGYRKKEYWRQEFQKDGHSLSWSEAMALFQDKTGRPGPATWVLGEYPKGEEDFPVTGVSWYEAAAYAEFVGKSLPTVYHWAAAASPADSPSVVPLSNFAGKGPARVGNYLGMSWTGAYDMAGNVKEWTLNEDGSGKRYIMGGAWNEPIYLFNDADASLPLERSANFGFRCARYDPTGAAAKAADPITRKARDFSSEKPVSDQVFQAYTRLYSYDRTPLNAVIESTEKTDEWKRETITFDAAYGNERITAYLFLPLRASPPYQTVLYFPGGGAMHVHSVADDMQSEYFDFVVKSGRAVMFPIYKGTFERRDSLKNAYPNTTSLYRDHVIAWSKDLGRCIDYLETRSDIDHNKLAYEGFSWGAAMGSVMLAIENRFKVAVLIAPGFYLQESSPEVDQLNLAPRVKIPVLMLNGHFDFLFPPQSSQEPMFRLLGTPKEQKRRVVYNTVHNVPQNEMIKETLNWLDRYLGPVN